MNNEKILNDIVNGRCKESTRMYNSPKLIGSIADILNTNKFRDISDYRKYYYEHILSKEKLIELSETIEKEIGYIYWIHANELYDYLDLLIFEKSWNGILVREKVALELLMSKYKCDWAKRICEIPELKMQDAHIATDIVVEKTNKNWIVQVKPKTFLSDKYSYHQKRNFEKNKVFLDDNKEYEGVIYMYFSRDNQEHDIFVYDKERLSEKIKEYD